MSLQVTTTDFCEINGVMENFSSSSSLGSGADGSGPPPVTLELFRSPSQGVVHKGEEKQSYGELSVPDKC